MTRLTNDIRDAIARALLAHRFQAEYDTLASEVASFARRVHASRFGADLARMEKLPKGWLPENTSIACSFGGMRFYLHFSGNHGGYTGVRTPKSVALRLTAAANNDIRFVSLPADHELSREFEALSAKLEAFSKAHATAARKAEAALASVGTIKRLIEAWPEVEPFAKAFVAQKPQLPAVSTDDLNASLRLPATA